jgi:hypothetical protein
MNSKEKVSVDSKTFFLLCFENLYKEIKKNSSFTKTGSVFSSLDLTRHAYISYTKLQDPIQVLLVSMSRKMAYLLINDQGKVDHDLLKELLLEAKKSRFYIAPGFEMMLPFMEHIIKILSFLDEDEELRKQVNLLQKPYLEKKARELIYRSLNLDSQEALDDGKTRVLALFLMLNLLRQSVGSCFATAPALIIQQEQLKQFLIDFDELVSTGKLKKVIAGDEFEVPISSSSGVGDLKRPVYIGKGGVKPWYSPSIVDALLKVGVIKDEGRFLEKVKATKEKIKPLIKKGGSFATVEQIFTFLIAEKLGLQPEEIEANPQESSNSTLLPLNVMKCLLEKRHEVNKMGGENELEKAKLLLTIAKESFKSASEIPFLKTWEFTLASFAECKADFCNWNMYHALGIDSKKAGGIGCIIFAVISRVVEKSNQALEEMQIKHQGLHTELKGVEGRLSRVSSESDLRWLKSKYYTLSSEFGMSEEKINNLHRNAKRITQLFPYLIDKYMKLFPLYFQEVYDAEMNDIQANLYDDRPAGFRLLYKHGRKQSYLWTLIYSSKEYLDALSKFFRQSELELLDDSNLEELQVVIQEIGKEIGRQIYTDEFLQSSLVRMSQAHQSSLYTDPLKNLDKLDKKPWAYTSGGSMEDLISVYYKSGEKPTQLRKKIKGADDLLEFIVETLRGLSEKELFNDKKEAYSFLMHSPTHAFVLRPDFLQNLLDSGDGVKFYLNEYKKKCKKVVHSQPFKAEYIEPLVGHLSKHLTLSRELHFSGIKISSWKGFRDHVLALIAGGNEQNKDSLSEELDGLLLQAFPLVPSILIKEVLFNYFSSCEKFPEKAVRLAIEKVLSTGFQHSYLSCSLFLQICQLVLIKLSNRFSFEENKLKQIHTYFMSQGLMYPKPLIFADTNWNHNYFSVTYNLFTESFELWRTEFNGQGGRPMHTWAKHFKGDEKSVWGIYIKPHEYRLH